MKKILCFILALIMIISLVACGKNNSDSTEQNNDTNITTTPEQNENNSTEQTTPTEPEKTEEEIKSEQEALKQQKREECENALKEIKFDVLNVSVVNYDKSHINGYGAYSTDYEKATIITIGMRMPSGVYNNHWKAMKISGETAMDAEGNPVPQTFSSAGWLTDNREYAILVYRLAGEVDASKVSIRIEGKTDDVFVETKFENNGENIGFDGAKEAFAEDNLYGIGNSIIKIKNRHYFVVRRYNSSSGATSSDEGRYSTSTKSFVLIPLENGFERTLTNDDFTLIYDGEVPNTTAKAIINQNGRIDASSLDSHTTIEIEVWRRYVEQEEADGGYSDEVYDAVKNNISEMFKLVHLETDDGEDNIIKLYFVDKK